jgi:hypothetical protein
MKRTAAIVSALALVGADALPAAAQTPAFGFRIGPAFSTLASNRPDTDHGTLTTLAVSAFARLPAGAFAVQPELFFITKGARPAGDAASDIRIDYIEVPLLLLLPIPAAPPIGYHLYLGPAPAFEVGCSPAPDAATPGSRSCWLADDAEHRRKFDVGAVIGAAVSLPAGPGAVQFDARFTHGLLNLYTGIEDVTVRNRSTALLASYILPLRRR